MNISLLPLCWLFLEMGYSAVSTFVVTIVVTIVNQIVCFYYLCKMYDIIRAKEYIKEVIIPCIVASLLAFLPHLLFHSLFSPGLYRLFLTCFVHIINITLVIYYVVLKTDERQVLKNKIHNIITKVVK